MNKLNTKKPIIGFDMDGVLLDHANAKIKLARKFGFKIKIHHTPSEIIRTILPPIILEDIQKILYDHHRVRTPLMRGVKNILNDLKSKKVPIYLISRRKIPDVAVKTLKDLALWPKYFSKKNTFFVSAPEDKNKMAARLKVTHYIDDELKIINVLSKVPNKFLFDQFNVFEKADHYTKIHSWAEFKEYIKLL